MCKQCKSAHAQTKKTVILGCGSWGTALAQVLLDNGHDVLLYGIDSDQVADINNNHKNSLFFNDLELSPLLRATMDIECVKEADVLLLAVPSPAVEPVCRQIVSLIKPNTVVVNVAKGFHPATNERISQTIRSELATAKISSVVSLMGPSHAEEVVQRLLTCVAAVGSNPQDCQMVQQMFANSCFRVYTGSDEIGTEYGAAVKNVIAIASGILAGLKQGDNARAALMTRGLREMSLLVEAVGGQPGTCQGLTGIGDLIVTCSSEHSRNFQAGKQIGQDNSARKFWTENKKTVEGALAARIVHDIALQHNLEMPICDAVFEVLYNGAAPALCCANLMGRQLKAEGTVR